MISASVNGCITLSKTDLAHEFVDGYEPEKTVNDTGEAGEGGSRTGVPSGSGLYVSFNDGWPGHEELVFEL